MNVSTILFAVAIAIFILDVLFIWGLVGVVIGVVFVIAGWISFVLGYKYEKMRRL
jgi:hypothetical protein